MTQVTKKLYESLCMPFVNLINLRHERKKYDIPDPLNSTSSKTIPLKNKTLELKGIIDTNIDLIVSFCKSMENLDNITFEIKDEVGFYKSSYFNESLEKKAQMLGVKLPYILKEEYGTLEFTVNKIQ